MCNLRKDFKEERFLNMFVDTVLRKLPGWRSPR